jgi:hypothetical protein
MKRVSYTWTIYVARRKRQRGKGDKDKESGAQGYSGAGARAKGKKGGYRERGHSSFSRNFNSLFSSIDVHVAKRSRVSLSPS